MKKAGYSVSQIKNPHRQTILKLAYFVTHFQPSDRPNTKRLMEIQSPIKDPFSTPNDSTPFDTKQQGMRYCTQLHLSSFSVRQSIQGLIGLYRDNIHKFVVFIQLILRLLYKLDYYEIRGSPQNWLRSFLVVTLGKW